MTNDVKGIALQSVFFKCTVLIGFAAVLVAISISFQSNRLSNQIASESVMMMGREITHIDAMQSGGAFRFGKAEPVQSLLDTTVAGADGTLIAALGMDAAGAVVASTGPDLDRQQQALETLAKKAIASGEPVTSQDGMSFAYPSTMGPNNAVVGAIAGAWSARFLQTQIASHQNRSYLISAGVLILVMLAAAILLKRVISRPLNEVGAAMQKIRNGDYSVTIPSLDRKDEIGAIARRLEDFRTGLSKALEATEDAVFKGAGFQNSSAALLMLDAQGRVGAVNPSCARVLTTDLGISSTIEGERLSRLHDVFAELGNTAKEDGTSTRKSEALLGDVSILIVSTPIQSDAGEHIGTVVEIQNVSAGRINASIMDALDAEWVQASFATDGHLVECNEKYHEMLGNTDQATGDKSLADVVSFGGTSGADVFSRLSKGESLFGRFEFSREGASPSVFDGALCAVKDGAGKVFRLVAIGSDITLAEQQLARSHAVATSLQRAQDEAVEGLREAIARLSDGDLTARIHVPFEAEYEPLRTDFNAALSRIEAMVIAIKSRAKAITGEIASISESSTNLSARTEGQAATLEETVAAIAKITSAVTTAADGAKHAATLVSAARTDAANSETVVEQAVDAVGKIEASSHKISQIVSVIDDIAFQTNLLALNAGVEAARAGESGRGFAVVASEVRELAQRSSKAAKEISEVIMHSRDNVESGVKLVRKAGDALNQIAASVSQISDHVTEIAHSTTEQSAGLGDINEAMGQLDTVTQHNVGTFEETAAAISVLSNETAELDDTINGFSIDWDVSDAVQQSSDNAKPEQCDPSEQDTTFVAPAPAVQIANGSAINFHVDPSDTAWRDF